MLPNVLFNRALTSFVLDNFRSLGVTAAVTLENVRFTELSVLFMVPMALARDRNVLAPSTELANRPNFLAVPVVKLSMSLVVLASVLAIAGPNRPNVLASLFATVVLRPFNVFLTAPASDVVLPVMLSTFKLTTVPPNLLVDTLFPLTVLWKPFAHVLPPSTVLRSPFEVLGTVLVNRP